MDQQYTTIKKPNVPNKIELLVLGNGFDLACGLKSSYLDYFNYRFKSVYQKLYEKKTSEPMILEKLNNHKFLTKMVNDIINDQSGTLNFWDALFLAQKGDILKKQGSHWYNIEEVIKATITWALFRDYKKLPEHYSEDINSLSILAENIVLTPIIDKYKSDPDRIAPFLLEELRKFEKNFSDYIWNKKLTNNYRIKAAEKLNEQLILKSQTVPQINTFVLSFNYSLSAAYDLNSLLDNHISINNWVNIHGYVGDPQKEHRRATIFGIDGTQIGPTDQRTQFTKTFRVAEEEIAESINFPQEVDEIVFYGHSLSQADYSYFNSIFDMYSLYSSKVKLIFYYATFSEKESIEVNKDRKFGTNHSDKEIKNLVKKANNIIKDRQIQGVNKLLYNYGTSLSSQHGNNLLHRLLLESRISIRPIEGDRTDYQTLLNIK